MSGLIDTCLFKIWDIQIYKILIKNLLETRLFPSIKQKTELIKHKILFKTNCVLNLCLYCVL